MSWIVNNFVVCVSDIILVTECYVAVLAFLESCLKCSPRMQLKPKETESVPPPDIMLV